MLKMLKHFSKSEDGAVAVDWVVLTAAIVGVAAGAIQTIGSANEALGTSVATTVAEQNVGIAD
ncbi:MULTISPECIES: hypothetical protein [unclassified Roseovarius]|uniref:hypothetical protein n=1 Tax=unclassified Roseovarius TaxID=2614913 RepID=UPI00273D0198|nr:hypothetical protein [Roseovarius sp. MMSF_3350]